jgi:hypothetical protein
MVRIISRGELFTWGNDEGPRSSPCSGTLPELSPRIDALQASLLDARSQVIDHVPNEVVLPATAAPMRFRPGL